MKMDRITGLASSAQQPALHRRSGFGAASVWRRLQRPAQDGRGLRVDDDRRHEGVVVDSPHGEQRTDLCGRRRHRLILALLEERFGGWGGEASTAEKPNTVLPNVETTTIFLVDKPGARLIVLNAFRRLDLVPTDDDWFNAYMANMMYGGMFSARINLNLREDKGWTYGARSGLRSDYTKALWSASTSVKTDTTADNIGEILREVSEASAERKFTTEEAENARGYLLGSRPVRYENAGALLSELQSNWLYGLPDNWITAYAKDNIRAVSLESAQAAWDEHIKSALHPRGGRQGDHLGGLQALELPIVEFEL